MKKLAALTSLGLLVLLVLGALLWSPSGVQAELALSPGVEAASSETQGPDLILPLPEMASRTAEAGGVTGGEAEVEPRAAPATAADAAAKPTSKAKTGTIVVCLDGADAEGAMVTIQSGTGLFMGGDVDPKWSQLHPMKAVGYQMGRVTIEDIRLGTWSIEVLEASGRMNRSYVSLSTATAHQQVTLAFGDGVFEGGVWKEDGQPWEDFLVAVSIKPGTVPRSYSPGVLAVPVKSPWRTWRRTDAEGRYQIEGMIRGTGWYVFATPGPLTTRMGDSRRRLASAYGIREGQQFIVNYGSPLGTANLKLRVRDGTGRNVRDGQVTLIARDAPPLAPGTARFNVNALKGKFTDDGIAEIEVAPGIYGVRVNRMDGDHGVIGDIELQAPGEVTLVVDLPPAHAIHGRAVGVDGLPMEGAYLMAAISLRREPNGRSLSSASLLADGSFAFLSVENGDYLVTMGEGETLSSVAVSVTGTSLAAFDVTLFGY